MSAAKTPNQFPQSVADIGVMPFGTKKRQRFSMKFSQKKQGLAEIAAAGHSDFMFG